eukprot:6115653-Karenia_brevis.AAC.1
MSLTKKQVEDIDGDTSAKNLKLDCNFINRFCTLPTKPRGKQVSAVPPIAQIGSHREQLAVSRGRSANGWIAGRLFCCVFNKFGIWL